MFSGEYIKACDYGINPRFLLAMARIADNARPRTSCATETPRGRAEKFRGL